MKTPLPDSSAKITSNGHLKPALLPSKTFKNCQNIGRCWCKIWNNGRQRLATYGMRLILFRSGNVMTSWCRMRHQVAALASIMTIMMSFWHKGTANAIGNWASIATKPPNLKQVNRFVWWMRWASWYLMRCLSRAMCCMYRPISPITGWPLTIVWLFPSDLGDLPHYSCSIVWQMSLPILMI